MAGILFISDLRGEAESILSVNESDNMSTSTTVAESDAVPEGVLIEETVLLRDALRLIEAREYGAARERLMLATQLNPNNEKLQAILNMLIEISAGETVQSSSDAALSGEPEASPVVKPAAEENDLLAAARMFRSVRIAEARRE